VVGSGGIRLWACRRDLWQLRIGVDVVAAQSQGFRHAIVYGGEGMKIAFLLYGIPQNGGVKVLFRVGSLLQARGHQVTYYVAETPRELPFPSSCEFVFACHEYRNAVGRVAWLARTPIDADVAIATFHPTAMALSLNGTFRGRGLYYVQAYEPDFYSDSALHILRRWPMMLAAAASYLLPLEIIVNCEGSKRGLTTGTRRRVARIPPGIDLGLYCPRLRTSHKIIVGHISRREAWKGSRHFFRAMAVLRDCGYQFHVRVAYDLCVETGGLQYEAIHPATEEELADYYSGLDVLVSTVTQKGFGYPPLEAMASGALCVATPMDFGQPGVDHLPILANSSDSIVRVMERVFALQARAPFIEAGLRTAATFDWERIADQWCTLLSGKDGARFAADIYAANTL
jgi:glycosyltransferase involved in cell wall biosynthesis